MESGGSRRTGNSKLSNRYKNRLTLDGHQEKRLFQTSRNNDAYTQMMSPNITKYELLISALFLNQHNI